MQQIYKGTSRSFFGNIKNLATGIAIVLVISLFGVTSASAQLQTTAVGDNYIEISNDRGGLLRDRILELQQLRQTGQNVRITGNICYSTCTMFLALPQTCISPQTTFGFHGPSSYGAPLDPAIFEEASQIMAAHYPDVLKDWYMKTGRHEIVDVYRFKGSDIIRMGIASCSAPVGSS
jgi:hypothetical protein